MTATGPAVLAPGEGAVAEGPRFDGMSGRRSLASIALALVGLLAACVNGDEADNTARDAAIYRSVILDVVERSGAELDEENLPVLFIEALGPDGIPLGVQVEVVGGFVEEFDIRFIDDFHEAVDAELPGLPVREGSLLIGLGDIDVEGTAEVHGEFYLDAEDITGLDYTLVGGGDVQWTILGGPVDVEAEGLKPTS